MDVHVCVFEDDLYENFFPLALTRPVFSLRYGIGMVWEKLVRPYSRRADAFFCRNELAGTVQHRNPAIAVNRIPEGDLLLLNGSVLDAAGLAETISPEMSPVVYLSGCQSC